MIAAGRNAYDHRLKQAIVETGDLDLFSEPAIPASTRRTWLRRGVADVVSFDESDADFHALRATIGRLNKRVAIPANVVRLLGDTQRQRIAANQALSCSACAPTDAKRHPLTASSSGPVP